MKSLLEFEYSPPSGMRNVQSLAVGTKGPGLEFTGSLGILKGLGEIPGSLA